MYLGFFFNDTATTEIYTLSLHDALPIYRRCEFCPRKDPTEYPNQNLNMDIRLARKIAEELKEYQYKGGVMLCGYGEPLLNQEIAKLVGVFGQEIHTELATNGDKLCESLVTGLF